MCLVLDIRFWTVSSVGGRWCIELLVAIAIAILILKNVFEICHLERIFVSRTAYPSSLAVLVDYDPFYWKRPVIGDDTKQFGRKQLHST